MTNQSVKRIRFTVGILLSVLVTAVGVLLAVSCVHIYQSGPSPFTRASIAAAFQKIAVPVWVCLAAIVAGGVICLFLPAEEARTRGKVSRLVTRKKLLERVELQACAEQAALLERSAKMRAAIRAGQAVLCILSAAVPLIYLFTPANFGLEDLNGDILSAVLVLLPFAVFAFGVSVLAELLLERYLQAEIELLKALAANGYAKKKSDTPAVPAKGTRYVTVLRIVLAAVGILLIVAGILNGGMRDVLGKAIKICTECIGLG